MARQQNKKIQLMLVRSPIASEKVHKACVKGLGLRRLRHKVIVEDTACTRGMINKVRHLVAVEEV